MRSRVRKAALMVLAGVLVLGLVSLVWATETASSEMGQDAMQNGPPASTLGMPNDMAGAAGDSEWTLVVDGLVQSPLSLTLDDLVAMPTSTVYAELYCIAIPTTPLAEGNWTGVRLGHILEEAGVSPEAVKVAFYADDGFATDLTVTTAMRHDIILAYERDGDPLTENLRLVVPCKWGYKWIRNLVHIELVDYDFLGFYENNGFSDEADIPGDGDGDGRGDACDNCADDYNPDQFDSEQPPDEWGDICDPDTQGSSAVSGADGSITLSDETGDITFEGTTAEPYRTVTIEDDAAGVGTTTVTAKANKGKVTKKFDIVSTSLLTGTVSVVIDFDPAVEQEKLNNMRVTKKVTGPIIEIPYSLDASVCAGGWCTQATISFQLDDDVTLTAIVPADTDSDGVYDQFDLNDDGDFDDPYEHDNCAYDPNALQEDFDTDEAGDACDCDDDNDGTPDNQETRDDTDPFDPEDYLPPDTDDTDSDGGLNWEEDWCGTDPNDACGDDCNESPPPAGTLDAWAYDINIDCWANAADILMFSANVNMPVQLGDPLNPTFQCRYDLDPDNWINAQDILMLPARVLPSMPKQCTNP